MQLDLWTILKHFFQDIFLSSLKLLRNMYAGLWEILRAVKICSLIPRSLVVYLHVLLSGTLAVNDHEVQNLCLYSFCEYGSCLHFCCLDNLCQPFLYVIECVDSLLVFCQMGVYNQPRYDIFHISVWRVSEKDLKFEWRPAAGCDLKSRLVLKLSKSPEYVRVCFMELGGM